ncbi:hypothetical protein BEP19_02460 [Ammoniphilus oxalaticus]|uniref:Copper amine oxidase-like N-terminal domain-containing protein n=1 Tax=Ammoniphilus oxalaticus TaxID=66863 RepID=A0A419SNE6_9BACL|nr:copper amine oxidase N-terminal domain-containing protein [Ammoniphilus oxalaticus]RKD25818.1 hypothetical protein BEP19_02460 [Ammoniphilus oxalaticus]
MKKLLKSLVMTVLVSSAMSSFALSANAATEVHPYIDSNNRTMVPVRYITEHFGAKVDWNGQARKVSIDHKGAHISFTIDNTQALVNNKPVIMDTKPVIQQGITYVPVRFIGEALGADIQWLAETRQVSITLAGKNMLLAVQTKLTEQQIKELIKVYDLVETAISNSLDSELWFTDLFESSAKKVASPKLIGIASKRFIEQDLGQYISYYHEASGEGGLFPTISFDARMQIVENTESKVKVKTFQLENESYLWSETVYLTFVKEGGKWTLDRVDSVPYYDEHLNLTRSEVQQYLTSIYESYGERIEFVGEKTVMVNTGRDVNHGPKTPEKTYVFKVSNQEYTHIVQFAAKTGQMVWE